MKIKTKTPKCTAVHICSNEKNLSNKSNSAVDLQLQSREKSALRISWLIDDLPSLDAYLMSVRLAAGRGHRFSERLCRPHAHII